MAVTHTGGDSPHATLALVLYQAQEVEGLRACTSAIAQEMADKSYLGRGISLSLTETGLVARPDSIGLSGQVWVKAQLTDHWMSSSSGDPYVNVSFDCFYGLALDGPTIFSWLNTNRVSNSIVAPREQLANRLESHILRLLQEQGKYQLYRIGMLP